MSGLPAASVGVVPEETSCSAEPHPTCRARFLVVGCDLKEGCWVNSYTWPLWGMVNSFQEGET